MKKLLCVFYISLLPVLLFGQWQEVNPTDIINGGAALGMPTIGRAVTATLFVSPNGDNSDGSTIGRAYQTIQGALSAASTDVNECTLILIGINTGSNFYNINTTGDPTFTGNYILKGSHRTWQKIKNTHASATSILKFTGYVSLIDLNFNLGNGGGNGVIITKGASRVYHCQFVGEDLTGAATAIHYDGATQLKHHKMMDCNFRGDVAYMTALLIDKSCCSNYERLVFHHCLTAIQIVDTLSDENIFNDLDIGDSSLGIDIDAGNEQHFSNVQFHHDTTNIDDEVGDHIFDEMKGDFPVTIEPTNLVGVTLTANATANVYGSDTELRAAVTSTKPFRIIGVYVEPTVSQWYQIRLSPDSGSTFFDQIMVSTSRSAGSSLPTGTGYIFNKGTRISASTKAESGGEDTIKIWLKVQEI